MASTRQTVANLMAQAVLSAVTPEAIRAESVRGRQSGMARRYVILRTGEGFAVYATGTGARLSRPVRSAPQALEDFAAIVAGIVLPV